MARTREFDPAEALEKAMGVFWRKGYLDTSIEDLVEATGVSRYGLYDVFSNKHGLFLAALDHYQESVVANVFGAVERPGASLDAVRGLFATLRELSGREGGAGKLGCLMFNTACELAPSDDAAAAKVRAFQDRLTAGFRHALDNARKKGELAPDFDVERHADFLAGVMTGLSAMARSGVDRRAFANMVAVALSTLG